VSLLIVYILYGQVVCFLQRLYSQCFQMVRPFEPRFAGFSFTRFLRASVVLVLYFLFFLSRFPKFSPCRDDSSGDPQLASVPFCRSPDPSVSSVVQTLSWLYHRGHGGSQRESERTVPPVSFQVLSFLLSSVVLEVFFWACVKLVKSSFKKRLLFPPQKGA